MGEASLSSQSRDDLVDRGVGERAHLVVGAVLDRVGHEAPRRGRTPSAAACAAAASTNSVEATKTPGTPPASRSTMSCTLHDVHDPQSARASITTSHVRRRSRGAGRSGAGLVNVGLREALDRAHRAGSSSSSRRSRKTLPRALEMSSRPTVRPSSDAGGRARVAGWPGCARRSGRGLERRSSSRTSLTVTGVLLPIVAVRPSPPMMPRTARRRRRRGR